jgi:hypothetical protein
MYKNDGRVLEMGESGSDNATRSRIQMMRRTGEIQVDYNARTTQNSRIVLPGAVSPLVSRAEVAQW